ncbi:DUF885 domain-containing protein [Herbiconiux sp. A18JL235]|uniref:DUF885 domain-containing protein n=1 Tax=Herbiconiux sp. A18JL235 TaxID=3152363 RepID=A0AB39BJH9_9MICO
MSTSSTRRIADDYTAALAAHEPAAAQALGQHAAGRLPDYSPEWAVERRRLAERVAVDLAGAPGATGASGAPAPSGASEDPDLALRAALGERMRSEAELFDTGFSARLLAPLASPVHEIRESFDDVTVTDDEAGDDVIERLVAVPAALADLRRRLDWARAAGEEGRFSGTGVAAARQVRAVAGQVRSWIDPTGTDYFSRIARGGLASSRETRLERAGTDAGLAFAEFASYLDGELLAGAPEEDAVGEQVYAQTARSFLGTPIDLDDIYDFGWAELDRLVAQSRRLAAQVLGVAGEADVETASRALFADERYRVAGRDNIVGWLRDRFEWTLERVQGAFDLPGDVREVDIVVPTAATGVVYYTPGAPDGSTTGKIVWTVPEGEDSISTWHEVTSFHHEGVPGHHLEHTTNRANSGLHPWQRYLCEIHGYAEGWAHYSEQLSAELGLLRDPAEELGAVLGQVWRAVRIVADIGLHTGRPVRPNALGAEGPWTPELARRFLVELALVDPRTAGFEVDRYLGWPGQALAFKVGAKLWLDARADAEARGIPASHFHRSALGLGPMGLGPLRELLSTSAPEPR